MSDWKFQVIQEPGAALFALFAQAGTEVPASKPETPDELSREVTVTGMSVALKIAAVLILALVFLILRNRMQRRAAKRREEREMARVSRRSEVEGGDVPGPPSDGGSVT